MISGIGGGMPSMDAMRQMQQKAFSKADANGSGSLNVSEFNSMVKDGPMAGKGPNGVSDEEMFKKIDGNGDGEITQAEMENAHKQMMANFQSTVQAFGQGGATAASSTGTESSLDTLLQTMGFGDSKDDKTAKSTNEDTGTTDLTAQLRSLLDKMSTTYGGGSLDSTRTLMATA